jgi:hypothetical protein
MSEIPFDGSGITPATMRYDIVMNIQGQEVAFQDPTREVAMVEHEGQPALAIVDRATLPPMMGSAAVVDSFVVARDDFAPLYRKLQQGPAAVMLTYDDGTITGQMSRGGQTMPFNTALDRPIIPDGLALEVGLSTLDLEEGYSASFATYSPIPGQQGLQTWTMTVTGTEEVTVPTGTYDTYVVEMDKADSNEDVMLYLDQETGMLVKSVSTLPAQMGGGSVVAELASAEM